MAIRLQLNKIWKLRFLSGVVVIALTCFLTGAQCKRSACWRYGHVCWGGHGKRSGEPPLMPPIDSLENEGGSRYPPTYPQSRLWEVTTNPFQHQFPLISNGPMNRQQLHSKVNPQLPSTVYTLQSDLLQRRPYYLPLQYQPIPVISGHNQRQMIQQQNDLGRNELEDEGLNNPDYLITPTDSTEILAATPVHSYSTALKRAADHIQTGTNNAAPTGRSTEEPLVTSANGQDSVSGPMSTFFRDRKFSLNNLEKERYLKSGVTGRLQNNIFDILPMTQFKGNGPPVKRFY